MKFEKVSWSGEVETCLAQSAGDDLKDIARLIVTGQAECWRVNDGETYLVTRIIQDELVLVCAEGRNLVPVGHYLTAQARRLGLKSIRFHTQRPGLARLLRAFKPVEVERIYRIDPWAADPEVKQNNAIKQPTCR